MQLENGVNGIARRRWDTQRAPKAAHLASKPIKLQTPACSRSYAIEALWDHALARAVLGVHVRVLSNGIAPVATESATGGRAR